MCDSDPLIKRNSIVRHLRNVVFFYDPEPVRVLLGQVLICWGAWLMLPLDTAAVSSNIAGLNRLLPEFWWGLMAVVIGATKVYTVGMDGKRVHSVVGLVAAVFFMVVTVVSAIDNLGIGTPIYGCLTLASSWAYVRTVWPSV